MADQNTPIDILEEFDMYDRYSDISKFTTDMDKLQIDEEFCIYISEYYDISLNLEDYLEDFEKQKPFIIYLIKHICELDNMVQRFHNSKKRQEKLVSLPSPFGLLRYDYCKSMENEPKVIQKDFPFELAVIYLVDRNIVVFDYWHTQENSQFEVKFEYEDGIFHLRSFGMFDCIPDNWEAKEI